MVIFKKRKKPFKVPLYGVGKGSRNTYNSRDCYKEVKEPPRHYCRSEMECN